MDSGLSIHRPIEAGSYNVLVDGRIPGQVGAYALKSAFNAEPGIGDYINVGNFMLSLNGNNTGP